MKLRIFVSLLIAVIIGAIPFAMMWLGGSDFVRGKELRDCFFAAVVLFIGSGVACFLCPAWDW